MTADFLFVLYDLTVQLVSQRVNCREWLGGLRVRKYLCPRRMKRRFCSITTSNLRENDMHTRDVVEMALKLRKSLFNIFLESL